MASLLLAGLGSLYDPLAADPVLELAVRLAGLGLDAWAGFWLEEPTLVEAARGCGDVAHVLPVLAAEDYFSRALIPREVGAQANGRRIVLHRPLGARAAFARLAASRVVEAGGPEARALVRPADDRASRRAAEGLIARLAPALDGGAVLVEGDVPAGPHDVWLPVRVRGGWFADASDVPLPDRAPRVEVPWRALDLVSMVAGLTHEFVTQTERPVDEPWGRLLERAAGGPAGLGELQLARVAPGLLELRPVLDAGRTDLETLVTLEGLAGRARRFADGRFRPVRGLRGVPRGWRAVLPDARARLAVQFLLQPGALPDSWAHQENALPVTGWDVTARRQTGLDARVRQATARDVEAVSSVVCASCLKTRLWAGTPLVGSVLGGQPGQIPCAEPCPVFVRAVRDRLSPQPARPDSLPADD